MSIHLNCLAEAVLTSTHILCFQREYVNYQNFLSEIFPVLVVKLSIYLNRHVFVMGLVVLVFVFFYYVCISAS